MSTSAPVGKLTLTGTGTSVGIPVVGCTCAVCNSDDPRNHRLRSGVIVEAPDGNFLIDTGPEVRLQMVQAGTHMIHAALFTHAHADHIMGLDDLRIFAFRLEKQLLNAAKEAATDPESVTAETLFPDGLPAIPLYCEDSVQQSLRKVFYYAFQDPALHSHHFAAPRLRFEDVQPGQSFSLLGLKVLPLRLHHGKLPILGYRIGNVAFCTDVSTIPAETRDQLQGLDVLILDCLRDSPHPTHMSVDQAVAMAKKLGAKRTLLTHISHELDFQTLANRLPAGIEPAYDGISIPLS